MFTTTAPATALAAFPTFRATTATAELVLHHAATDEGDARTHQGLLLRAEALCFTMATTETATKTSPIVQTVFAITTSFMTPFAVFKKMTHSNAPSNLRCCKDIS